MELSCGQGTVNNNPTAVYQADRCPFFSVVLSFESEVPLFQFWLSGAASKRWQSCIPRRSKLVFFTSKGMSTQICRDRRLQLSGVTVLSWCVTFLRQVPSAPSGMSLSASSQTF